VTVVLHRREVVTSTNDEALALAQAGAADGAVVVARAQTHGRGRQGRTWESPDAGNVYLSLFHVPDLSPAELAGLTLDVATAAAEVLAGEGALVRLKWPNDLLVGGRKVGGILTELHLGPGGESWVIIGLGLNVNGAPDALPPEVARRATSLRRELGRELDVDALAEHLAAALYRACLAFAGRGGPDVAAWSARAMTVGQRVRVTPGGAEGRAVGVAADGALLVRFDGRDEPEAVRSGVVEHLLPGASSRNEEGVADG